MQWIAQTTAGYKLLIIVHMHTHDSKCTICTCDQLKFSCLASPPPTECFMHVMEVLFTSVQPTTLSTTQQVMVVQSTLMEVLLASLEPTTSYNKSAGAVAQSPHQQLLLASLEPKN